MVDISNVESEPVADYPGFPVGSAEPLLVVPELSAGASASLVSEFGNSALSGVLGRDGVNVHLSVRTFGSGAESPDTQIVTAVIACGPEISVEGSLDGVADNDFDDSSSSNSPTQGSPRSDRPRFERVVLGAFGPQHALDESNAGGTPRRAHQLAEDARHVRSLLEAGDGDVTEELRSDRFVAELASGADHLACELVGARHGDEKHAAVAHVDCRPELDGRRLELRRVERRCDIVRVGSAEESQRHVPAIWRNESSPNLILAMQFLETYHDLLRRPETDKQAAHDRSVPATGSAWARGRGRQTRSGGGSGQWVCDTVGMEVSISAPPNPVDALGRLRTVLEPMASRVVACSGGIDSLLLAHVAHTANPTGTLVAHTITPAVPGDGTARVVDHAELEGWNLHTVRSGEFDDESYLANPTDRCYHCKSNLYDAVIELRDAACLPADAAILSGANVDDLGEYRPGLAAAAEREVRHPYVEAEITKSEIRSMARHLGLAEADLPASPCLASRLYTGTRVTASRLRAIEAGEALVRERSGIAVVRCRVREESVLVEVADVDRDLIDARLLAGLTATMRSIEPSITSVELDERQYAPGRAFVGARGDGHSERP